MQVKLLQRAWKRYIGKYAKPHEEFVSQNRDYQKIRKVLNFSTMVTIREIERRADVMIKYFLKDCVRNAVLKMKLRRTAINVAIIQKKFIEY